MKLLFSAFLFVFAINASASTKFCQGSAGHRESRGEVFLMVMSAKQIDLKALSNMQAFVGAYDANGDTNVRADGKTYVQYEGDVDGDHNVFQVDRDLLKPGTTGKVYVNSNFGSEGTGDELEFNCRDN
jgi:hypothetical protein